MKPIPHLFLALLLSSAVVSLRGVEPKTGGDNTGINQRDRDGKNKTPPDQSNKPEDLKLTQAIRLGVVQDDHLSITAQNVKIITVDGVVTLRGPVRSEAEKATIDKIAKQAAGDSKVINQLEIAK